MKRFIPVLCVLAVFWMPRCVWGEEEWNEMDERGETPSFGGATGWSVEMEELLKQQQLEKQKALINDLKRWGNTALVMRARDALIMKLEPTYLSGNSWKEQTRELCGMLGTDVWYRDVTAFEIDYFVNCNGVRLKNISDPLDLFDNLQKFSQLRFDTQNGKE